MKIRKATLGIFVTLVLLAMLFVPASPVAAANVVSINPASQQQPVSSSFTVQVSIDSVSNFDAAQYDVTYDPSVIVVTNVTDGDIGGTTIPAEYDLVPTGVQGTVRVINNVPDAPGVDGSGYLAEIHFDVVGASGTSSGINFSNGILDDNTGTEITGVTWNNGSVNIASTLNVDFSASPVKGIVNETITFTDETSGGSGVYDTYEWDFNDDDIIDSTEANPSHIYSSAGTYTVELTVTDSLAASDTETKIDYITIYDPLDAEFYAVVTEALVDQSIQFYSGNTTGGEAPYTYFWDFDDGNTSTLENPSNTYTSDGTYTVTLTVTDSLTNEDVETKTGYITIYPALVTEFYATTTKALVGETIKFYSGNTTGGKTPYTYEWDFDDTGTSGLENPTHSYGSAGLYTVTLVVTDDLGNTDDFTVDISVFQLGDANEDGTVSSLDITHIEHIIFEHDGYEYTKWADANEDAVVNVLDITTVELIILP